VDDERVSYEQLGNDAEVRSLVIFVGSLVPVTLGQLLFRVLVFVLVLEFLTRADLLRAGRSCGYGCWRRRRC
jgi:hypothetical protein